MILIVDDLPDGATALCKLLRRAGYSCDNVPTGSEALARMRLHPPEEPLLVVLDEMMPEMSGMDVLRAIRDDPKLSATTVIMYSAGFDVGKREQAMALGAVAWLLKGAGYAAEFNAVVRSIGEWYEKAGGVALERRKQSEDSQNTSGAAGSINDAC